MSLREFEVTDAQVHVWKESTPERPWNTLYADTPHGPANWLTETVIEDMDRAGVQAGIIVPTSFEGDRNDMALEASHTYPDRFRMHARFPLANPAIGPEILEAQRDRAQLGVRLTFNAAAATWVHDGTIEWFWDYAGQRGIPISLFPVGDQVQLLDGVGERHPRTRITVDHLATSTAKTGYDTFDRIDQLEPLGRHANFAVKASALPVSFPKTYSVELVRTVIDKLMSWFGPDRIFWGSDYTRLHDPADYGSTLRTFRRGIAHLSAADQERILGAGIRDWFGWRPE